MARWHQGRARGQLERIERVEGCGSEHYELACKACGCVAEGEHERECSSWRYCVPCKGRRARRYRERFREGRAQWLSRCKRYERERFLTVTVPHSGLAADVRILLKSWERFTRTLRRWLRRRGTPFLAYVRALEITPSDGGHAHMHAWIGSPYLPHAVLRVLWGRALSSSYVPVRPLCDVLAELKTERDRAELERVARWRGRARAFIPWPILDIRAVHGDPADELVKYLLKDVEHGELIDPLLAANMVEASEGARVVASSRGYWVIPLRSCVHCEAPATWLILPRHDPSLRGRPGSDRDP